MRTTNKSPQAARKIDNSCPKCGAIRELQPHPSQPGRLVMICPCNPAGPVLETDAAGTETQRPGE